ncbi:MAG: hypothetical protein J7L54_04085 [Elusimicrobia bacterium]|nr:hypothetical protein [Elusimicrobiota bacterium]
MKIKKLKVTPSAGRIFHRVYEKGNPASIPRIKEEIKNSVSAAPWDCALFYVRNNRDFVFAGKIYGDLPEGKIGTALAGEIFSKLKRVFVQILMRESEGKKTSFEVAEIPPAEAVSFLGLEIGDFVENSIGGVVRPAEKKKR